MIYDDKLGRRSIYENKGDLQGWKEPLFVKKYKAIWAIVTG